MDRRNIGSFIWIAYIAIWALLIVIVPRFFPHYSGYGYFLPFFFFFPFFRRRRRGARPSPTPAPTGAPAEKNDKDYSFENMLSDENYKPPYPLKNYILYAVGATIIIAAIVLMYYKIF